MSSREEVVELLTGASEVIATLTLHLYFNHRTEHRKVVEKEVEKVDTTKWNN